MLSNRYEEVLAVLSKEVDFHLSADSNNSCLLSFEDGFEIQVEMEPKTGLLVIGTALFEIPPGKYRENVFTEALKANHRVSFQAGILSFSPRKNSLILFEKIDLEFFKPVEILPLFQAFCHYSKIWRQALQMGHYGPSEEALRPFGG